MTEPDTMLAAALEYEALGRSVILLHGIRDGKCTCTKPSCDSPGKHPIGPWKHCQETRATPDDLRAQFQAHPHANVGVVTGAISGLVVLDIDSFEGIGAVPELKKALDGVRLAKTPVVLTGRTTATTGAWHVYFRHPGHTLGNFAKAVPGLDGRGDGGIVVAPPSNHASGQHYRFEEGFGPDTPLLETPPAILALFERQPTVQLPAAADQPALTLAPISDPYAASALTGEVDRVRAAPKGERNNSLNIAALKLGQLVADGSLGRGDVERELYQAALGVGLGEDEARATITSGIDAGLSKPRPPRPARGRNSSASASTLHEPSAPWGEYEPLIPAGEAPAPYPIGALPDVIREAVLEYHDYGQQPLALVACSAIGNLALAAQGRANVARDRHLTGPISLSMMVIAESGERKTSVDKAFGAVIRKWEEAKEEESAAKVAEYDMLVRAFEAKVEGKRQAISRASKEGDSTTILEEFMVALEAERPKPPRVVKLYHEDKTIETLMRDMAHGWPSTSWWSDEGGIIVGGHSMKDDNAIYTFACINKLWDGSNVPSRGRITTGSFKLRGRRLTVSFAFQKAVLAQLLGTGKGAGRGTGFLARFLMCEPESTMGTRLYKEPAADLPFLHAYHEMLRAQLEAGVRVKEGSEDYEIDPPLLIMTPAAKAAWVAFYNAVERELRSSGEFEDVKDFASKSADNAIRLAALFHFARGRGPEDILEQEDVERGCAIARWHLCEARRIMGAQASPEYVSADRLLQWITAQGGRVRAQQILTHGPIEVRKAKDRNAALAILAEHDAARSELEEGIQYVRVRPAT